MAKRRAGEADLAEVFGPRHWTTGLQQARLGEARICLPCIEEMPMLDAFAADHADRGVVVLGIAEDDPDAVRAFLDRQPVDYPILIGSGVAGSSMQLGNSRRVLPYTALFGRDGRLLERRAGLMDKARLDAWLQDNGPDG